MPAKYFTIEQANTLLPTIKPMLEEILVRRTHIVESRATILDLLETGQSDIGGRAASALVQDFIKIERLSNKIRARGCLLKDLNKGLIDFLSIQDGREVYLCWQIGEPNVAFYHELHTGFAGRQNLNKS
jgi:hypothetical protein